MWMFSNAKSLNKIEDSRRRIFRFLFGGYEILPSKTSKLTINVITLRTLCIEICKTTNKLRQPFMKMCFYKLKDNNRLVPGKSKLNL